ncbi:ATP-binding protein [Roseateles noduli]|uniref:ATP-binding protein n=1 Tax=Roseateles noduli TaxID=2052484 RepID=UPI003D655890
MPFPSNLRRTVAAKHPSARYRFSSFELQLDERRLLASGAPVAIGPRAFDLLTVLVERAGHLVTKDELLERAWPKVIVEEAALQMQISSLRKILGRDAIVTVTGRGYRWTPETSCVLADDVPSDARPAHNLPQPLSSFVGREAQVSELKGLLNSSRLLTLVGSGGCGKTRLALRVAAEVVDRYPDGIWLVELAALSKPPLVSMALGHVLGLQEESGRTWIQTISAQLVSRNLLIILDNAEHLLPACADVAYALLSACPGISMLVTSRERLGIIGETAYRVPPLSVPRHPRATPEQVAESEAGRLFIDRARLQHPRFAITADDSPALASICRRLGGIPLAIELAAARTRQMPVQEVCRRLDQRFELLTGGSRVALPRQRTLRSLIDWSYDLLNSAEQELFRRVSVFSGGCTLEAVVSVCAGDGIEEQQVLELLTSLTDKSLLLARECVGETRYEAPETVRHYARERLCKDGGAPAWLLQRHFDYMHDLAQRAESRLASDDRHLWLARLEVEQDNLRAALAWSRVNDGSLRDGLHLASCLVLACTWANP